MRVRDAADSHRGTLRSFSGLSILTRHPVGPPTDRIGAASKGLPRREAAASNKVCEGGNRSAAAGRPKQFLISDHPHINVLILLLCMFGNIL